MKLNFVKKKNFKILKFLKTFIIQKGLKFV